MPFKLNSCRYDAAVYAGTELAAVGERLARERDRFVRAWASHEASTRRRAFAGRGGARTFSFAQHSHSHKHTHTCTRVSHSKPRLQNLFSKPLLSSCLHPSVLFSVLFLPSRVATVKATTVFMVHLSENLAFAFVQSNKPPMNPMKLTSERPCSWDLCPKTGCRSRTR